MAERNRRTPEGAEIGRLMARFCDEAEPRARLRMPELPPRCNSCAFREGAHLANGSPATQMDAIKCVIERIEFHCHEPARAGAVCSGWAMMMLGEGDDGVRARLEPGKVPWDFVGGSDADH